MKKNIILNNPDFLRGSLNILTSELIIKVFEAIQNNESKKIYPLSVHFEITNRCNSRCNHCERWKWKNQKELDTHNILNIIDILTFLRVKTLTIGGGEPFLYTGLNSETEYLANILREGFKGYNNYTAQELKVEYRERIQPKI